MRTIAADSECERHADHDAWMPTSLRASAVLPSRGAATDTVGVRNTGRDGETAGGARLVHREQYPCEARAGASLGLVPSAGLF